jgi:transcriptional regulator with XRE-family HTH domain
MRALLHTEFDAPLARAGVTQASFARLTGVTPRQVNNWAPGRALVPQWAALLALALQDLSPEALTIALKEAEFSWREIRGVPPGGGAEGGGRAGAPLPSGQGRPARADDPHQCRIRKRAARHVYEKVTDPLNAKGTN